MIDGFRYGFFGVSDVAPGVEPGHGRGKLRAPVLAATLWLLKRGYKLVS